MTTYPQFRALIRRAALGLARNELDDAMLQCDLIKLALLKSEDGILAKVQYSEIAAWLNATYGTLLLMMGAREGAAECLKIAMFNAERFGGRDIHPNCLWAYNRVAMAILIITTREPNYKQIFALLSPVVEKPADAKELFNSKGKTCVSLHNCAIALWLVAAAALTEDPTVKV